MLDNVFKIVYFVCLTAESPVSADEPQKQADSIFYL